MDEEVNEEQVDDKENREKVEERRCWMLIHSYSHVYRSLFQGQDGSKAAASAPKGWTNKADKKKKTSKDKGKKKGPAPPAKPNNNASAKPSANVTPTTKSPTKDDDKDSSG